MHRRILAPLLASAALCPLGADTPAAPHPAPLRAKVTFENVGMPFPGETLGLGGFNLLHDFRNGAYLGIASYGALTGVRGGFITAGLSGGYRFPLGDRIQMDAGVHVGGGGAGRAAVGGGLMLRAHAGFDVKAAGLLWGAEFAKVRFPNGRIDSHEVAFSVALPFRAWLDGGAFTRWDASHLPGLGWGEGALSLQAMRYQPLQGVHLLSGPPDTTPLELVGLTASADLNAWSFVTLDMAAAGHGKADGYMEILLGAGARVALTPGGGLRAYVRGAVGPAGGGDLDVGGGTAYRAAAGLEARIGTLILGAEAGYLTTPSASFKARTYQISVGRSFTYARPGGRALAAGDAAVSSPYRVRSGVLHLNAPQRRAGASPEAIDLTGIQMDSLLNEHVYFTGAGYFGTNGHAGGFAIGVVGLGLRSAPLLGGRGPRAFLEVLGGAAGGGGVDTGGGAVLLPLAGLEQALSPNLFLTLKAGRVATRRGSLSTGALEASLGYRFGFLERGR